MMPFFVNALGGRVQKKVELIKFWVKDIFSIVISFNLVMLAIIFGFIVLSAIAVLPVWH
ncbi:hypothetical protein WANG_p1089 (plasmid) [Lactobacillus kefiranofaciens subsp. kefiranofaciens]|nr:hypothetical protein WANG_p1089 [Lactobacillus kefiranofaciens subsp. kefiranofaciens]